VDEVFGGARHIVIHDMLDAFDVDARAGDVGGDEDAVVAVLESTERLQTLILAAIAVDGGGFHACRG